MTHDTPPKRIWATEDAKNFGEDRFHSTRPFKSGHEYILTSEAEAMVAAALREAAELVADDHVSDAILNLADNHAAAALDKLIAEAQKREAGYQEALIWCSGSDDFQADGKARAGWLKLCAPLIDRAALSAAPTGEESNG